MAGEAAAVLILDDAAARDVSRHRPGCDGRVSSGELVCVVLVVIGQGEIEGHFQVVHSRGVWEVIVTLAVSAKHVFIDEHTLLFVVPLVPVRVVDFEGGCGEGHGVFACFFLLRTVEDRIKAGQCSAGKADVDI